MVMIIKLTVNSCTSLCLSRWPPSLSLWEQMPAVFFNDMVSVLLHALGERLDNAVCVNYLSFTFSVFLSHLSFAGSQALSNFSVFLHFTVPVSLSLSAMCH